MLIDHLLDFFLFNECNLEEEIKKPKCKKSIAFASLICNFQEKKIDFKNSQSCYFGKGSDESVFFFDSFKGWRPCVIFQTPSS